MTLICVPTVRPPEPLTLKLDGLSKLILSTVAGVSSTTSPPLEPAWAKTACADAPLGMPLVQLPALNQFPPAGPVHSFVTIKPVTVTLKLRCDKEAPSLTVTVTVRRPALE